MGADVYFTLPATRQPQNLIDGLLYISPLPSERHEEIESELHAVLLEFAAQHGGRVLRRPFDCELNETTVVQPDLCYVIPERVRLAGRYLRGAPDVAIEIV